MTLAFFLHIFPEYNPPYGHYGIVCTVYLVSTLGVIHYFSVSYFLTGCLVQHEKSQHNTVRRAFGISYSIFQFHFQTPSSGCSRFLSAEFFSILYPNMQKCLIIISGLTLEVQCFSSPISQYGNPTALDLSHSPGTPFIPFGIIHYPTCIQEYLYYFVPHRNTALFIIHSISVNCNKRRTGFSADA